MESLVFEKDEIFEKSEFIYDTQEWKNIPENIPKILESLHDKIENIHNWIETQNIEKHFQKYNKNLDKLNQFQDEQLIYNKETKQEFKQNFNEQNKNMSNNVMKLQKNIESSYNKIIEILDINIPTDNFINPQNEQEKLFQKGMDQKFEQIQKQNQQNTNEISQRLLKFIWNLITIQQNPINSTINTIQSQLEDQCSQEQQDIVNKDLQNQISQNFQTNKQQIINLNYETEQLQEYCNLLKDKETEIFISHVKSHGEQLSRIKHTSEVIQKDHQNLYDQVFDIQKNLQKKIENQQQTTEQIIQIQSSLENQQNQYQQFIKKTNGQNEFMIYLKEEQERLQKQIDKLNIDFNDKNKQFMQIIQNNENENQKNKNIQDTKNQSIDEEFQQIQKNKEKIQLEIQNLRENLIKNENNISNQFEELNKIRYISDFLFRDNLIKIVQGYLHYPKVKSNKIEESVKLLINTLQNHQIKYNTDIQEEIQSIQQYTINNDTIQDNQTIQQNNKNYKKQDVSYSGQNSLNLNIQKYTNQKNNKLYRNLTPNFKIRNNKNIVRNNSSSQDIQNIEQKTQPDNLNDKLYNINDQAQTLEYYQQNQQFYDSIQSSNNKNSQTKNKRQRNLTLQSDYKQNSNQDILKNKSLLFQDKQLQKLNIYSNQKTQKKIIKNKGLEILDSSQILYNQQLETIKDNLNDIKNKETPFDDIKIRKKLYQDQFTEIVPK